MEARPCKFIACCKEGTKMMVYNDTLYIIHPGEPVKSWDSKTQTFDAVPMPDANVSLTYTSRSLYFD